MTTLEALIVGVALPVIALHVIVFLAAGWRLGVRMMDDVYNAIKEDK